MKVVQFWDWDWCASLQCVLKPLNFWNYNFFYVFEEEKMCHLKKLPWTKKCNKLGKIFRICFCFFWQSYIIMKKKNQPNWVFCRFPWVYMVNYRSTLKENLVLVFIKHFLSKNPWFPFCLLTGPPTTMYAQDLTSSIIRNWTCL